MADLLDPDEISRVLTDLPGVVRRGEALVAVTRAPSFPDAIRLVDTVAEQAEEMNHHPDIDVRWREVTFTLSTHSAGGITALDIELARRILTAAAALGASTGPAGG
jgi:4a-hydroxytetrahydrobiopterin dehydratase